MAEHAVVHPFAAWEGYYVIVGTAAAALTGLQFVVMTLISEFDQPRGTREVAAFGSPTVVHFGSSLLISGILTAPWPGMRPAGTAIALAGLGGLIYAAIVLRRALRQKGYKPVFEDWLSHTILPTLAYLAIFAGTTWLAFAPKQFAMVNVGLVLFWLVLAFAIGRMFKERSGGEA